MLERTTTHEKNAPTIPVGESARTQLKNGSLAEPGNRSATPAPHLPVAEFSQGKSTDVRVTTAAMYLLPLTTRVPLKFGAEIVTQITCLRICLAVCNAKGRQAEGWGETPVSVQWAWPSEISYEARLASMTDFCRGLNQVWPQFSATGHPMEIGSDFLSDRLPELLKEHNSQQGGEPMPYLAALICASAFDIALHDAYGNLHNVDIYETYNAKYMSRDLASFLEPAEDCSVSFEGQYPEDYFVANTPRQLAAWHLVGGLDPIDAKELTGEEPEDGYPVLLRDWITRGGLKCLKIKLRGNDATWDYNRLVEVGKCSIELGVESLSADFNCCVQEPAYVIEILDKLSAEHPAINKLLLYVEQPFPYELEKHRIDAHSISERKPLFLDESAHDWQHVRLGRELGWNGVALKTCKTQTGALLSLCWAKAHGMPLMVQDLTNPMLAQIPHVRLAAHAGTICGVETNAMQFYPDASTAEAEVHPGLYKRCDGEVDLSTIGGPGFGYRLNEIQSDLPEPLPSLD